MPTPDQTVALRIAGRDLSVADVIIELEVAENREYRTTAATRLIVRFEASRRGLSVTDAELQLAADAFRLKQGLLSVSATHDWLAARLWSVDDFERHLEYPLLRAKLESEIASPEDVELHFAECCRDFDRAEISHLVVADRAIADELLAQLNDDGADFGDLARTHSIDPLTARLGGRIGVTDRSGVSKAIESAVFSAQEGDIAGPFQTAMGWHLVLIERLTPGQLDDELRSRIRSKLFQNWSDEQLGRVEFPPFQL